MSMGNAYRLIKHGYIDASLSGGIEINVQTRLHRWLDVMGALNTTCNDDPEGSMKPFDVTREGSVLGDGGSIII
jgi:3-oxoacyl-[acyl-carrier-protein] synthase II